MNKECSHGLCFRGLVLLAGLLLELFFVTITRTAACIESTDLLNSGGDSNEHIDNQNITASLWRRPPVQTKSLCILKRNILSDTDLEPEKNVFELALLLCTRNVASRKT
jgi:hypothetical protein